MTSTIGNGSADGTAPVRSVDRALRVLEILAREGEAGLGQLALELDVHKSTVSRLVEVLVHHDLVEPPEAPGRYRLGVGCLRLAGAAAARLDLTTEAQPVCDKLAAALGETVNVALASAGTAVNVCQAEGGTAVAIRNWIGQRTALHATSSGKVLLAHLDEDGLRRALSGHLEAFTPHTITDHAELRRVLQEIRKQGFAYAVEEFEEGLNAVAAPVRDHSGGVVAAISAAGPAYRLSPERLPEARDAVLAAATEVSRRLGHQPSLAQP